MGKAIVTVSARADIEEDWIVECEPGDLDREGVLFDRVIDGAELLGVRVVDNESDRGLIGVAPYAEPEVHDLAVVTGMALNRIPVELWACSDCGSVFLPDWIGGEPGEVYPDRYEMTVPHRAEPDNHQCDCHDLPRTMKIPKDDRKDI